MPVQNWYMWDDSSSLIDRAKIIITPYGVYEDTGVKNTLPNLGTNLQVIDEDESQQEYQKNWKSKLPDLDISEDSNVESNENAKDQEKKEKRKSSSQKDQEKKEKRKSSSQKDQEKKEKRKSSSQKDQEKKEKRKSQMSSEKKGSAKQIVRQHKGLQFGRTSLSDNEEQPPEDFTESEGTSSGEELLKVDKSSGKKKSLSSYANRSGKEKLSPTKNSLKKTIISSTDKVRQKLNDIKKIPEPKIRVLPPRQKTLRTKTSPKKQSPVKQSLGSMNTRSLSTEEKQQSNKPAQPVSKKDSSPHQSKKRSLPGVKKMCPPLIKGNVPPSQQNKPVITRKGNKRKASESPETKIPAKRAKTNNKTVTHLSKRLTRVSASNEKEESIISASKKQKKSISQPTNEDETNSEGASRSGRPSELDDDLLMVNIEANPKITIGELAEMLEVPKSTVHEHLVKMIVKRKKVLPTNPDLLQSESEIFEAISLGFDSSASNKKSHKDVVLSSKGSDITDSASNSSDRIDILRIFDSKELNPKLDKTDEKTEKISSCSQSNSVDEPKKAHQKPEEKKRDSATQMTPVKI